MLVGVVGDRRGSIIEIIEVGDFHVQSFALLFTLVQILLDRGFVEGLDTPPPCSFAHIVTSEPRSCLSKAAGVLQA